MVKELDTQDQCSDIAYGWAQKSFATRDGKEGHPIRSSVAQFSSWLDVRGMPVAMTSDGIGTKIEVAERVGRYDTLGFDLCAMVVDDLAANGVEPIALQNTLDVDVLDPEVVDALMRGLHAAAQEAKVAVVGGEIAELGSRVGGYGPKMHFNWCSTALGMLRASWAPIDGTTMKEGDAVISLESTSFRSNGFSALRRTLAKSFGDAYHTEPFAGRTWGDWLLEPCRLYAPIVTALRAEGLHPSGLAHITGGGMPSKFGRTLKAGGLGVHLDNLFDPTPAMLEVQRLGDIADADAYRHWNMGNGFMVVVPPARAEETAAFCTERGYRARIAGRTIRDRVVHIERGKTRLDYPMPAP